MLVSDKYIDEPSELLKDTGTNCELDEVFYRLPERREIFDNNRVLS